MLKTVDLLKVITQMFGDFPKIAAALAIMDFERY